MALRVSQTVVKVLGTSSSPEVRIGQLTRNILVQNKNAYVGDGNIQVSFTEDNPSCAVIFTPNFFYPATGDIIVEQPASCAFLSDICYFYLTDNGTTPDDIIVVSGSAAACVGAEIIMGGFANAGIGLFFKYVGSGNIQVSQEEFISDIRVGYRYFTCNGIVPLPGDLIKISGNAITLLNLFYTGTGGVQVSFSPTNPSCAELRRLCPGNLNIITVNGTIGEPIVVRNNTDCKFEGGFPCPIPEEGGFIDCAIGRWYNPRCKNINFICGCPSFPRNSRGPNKIVSNGFLAPVIACRQKFYVPVPLIDPNKDDYAERIERIGGPFQQVDVGGIVKPRWADKKKVRFSQLRQY